MNANSIRVTTGQQRRPRSRAHWLRHVEIAEYAPLPRQPVEVWRLKPFRSENTYIRIALIVSENDDYVRRGNWF